MIYSPKGGKAENGAIARSSRQMCHEGVIESSFCCPVYSPLIFKLGTFLATNGGLGDYWPCCRRQTISAGLMNALISLTLGFQTQSEMSVTFKRMKSLLNYVVKISFFNRSKASVYTDNRFGDFPSAVNCLRIPIASSTASTVQKTVSRYAGVSFFLGGTSDPKKVSNNSNPFGVCSPSTAFVSACL